MKWEFKDVKRFWGNDDMANFSCSKGKKVGKFLTITEKIFLQILWKNSGLSWLLTFPSHLKRLRSKLR